ncbi:hypothetical protein ANCDUO_07000 [Ancylostoma duodenale]|uniref:SSD domain-containing protein n=1 Tax=Ancylostoma duodenale TaxID=51022 RepID=A0A0C2GN33_9BILA|nr:hypothetical protein ANCDUO_07000 [Ancylostoma duodenale]
MMAGKSLQPFLLVGFVIMCTFCTVTTMLSSVIMYHHKASINKVLVETGPSITISAFTNILAFAIGAYSSPPEIRLFCIGNAACIFMDMTYQRRSYIFWTASPYQ